MQLKLFTAALAVILMTSFFHQSFPFHSNKTTAQNRNLLEEKDPNALFDLQVNLLVGAEDAKLILDTPHLKSGFEQALKDFLNPDPSCKNDHDLPSYRGIGIDLNNQPRELLSNKNDASNCILLNSNLENTENIKCYIIVNSKCSGKRKECAERVNDRFLDNLKSETSKEHDTKKGSCGTTLPKLLEKITFSNAILHFEVDDSFVREDAEFSFTFESSNDRLSGAETIAEEPNITPSKAVLCSNQCQAQHQVLQNIYKDFGEDFFYSGDHECDHKGINCNKDDLVTHMRLSESISYFVVCSKITKIFVTFFIL